MTQLHLLVQMANRAIFYQEKRRIRMQYGEDWKVDCTVRSYFIDSAHWSQDHSSHKFQAENCIKKISVSSNVY